MHHNTQQKAFQQTRATPSQYEIRNSQYIFHEILQFMDVRNQTKLQILSKRFYDVIIPDFMSTVSVRNGKHAKKQDKLYHYASGFILYRDMHDLCFEAECGPQSNQKWRSLAPRNVDYMKECGLDKQLKFGRTIYIPYDKVIVISGSDIDAPQAGPVRDVFQFHLTTMTVEKLPPISTGRTSFAAHYDFEDKFIYVLGGTNKSELMIKDCEKYDVYNQRWHPMPAMNFERGNPGSYVSSDKRYLYAFQGFINKFNQFRSRQSEALDSVDRLDLQNESLGWQVLDVKEPGVTPRGCFIMQSLADVTNWDSAPNNKVLIFGGWKPYQNLADIQMFDLDENKICDIAKFAKQLKSSNYGEQWMSASTAHESNQSSGEEIMESSQTSKQNQHQDRVQFKIADKFTKKPLKCDKYLVFLGRSHIQMFDSDTFKTKILINVGEDQAERVGYLLKTNPDVYKNEECGKLSSHDFHLLAPTKNFYQRTWENDNLSADDSDFNDSD